MFKKFKHGDVAKLIFANSTNFLSSIGKQLVYLYIIIWDLSPYGGRIPYR